MHDPLTGIANRRVFLERLGILAEDPSSRFALLMLDLDDLKWVVLMVMFNQPGQEAAYAWIQGHLLESEGEPVH